jgi:putative FmdB family regulatory protein
MPTYDYECAACGRRFEVIHGVHAEGPTSCPLCGKGPVRKVITAANVHYKGSGWAKKERRSSVGSGASKSGGDGSSSEDGSKSDAAASSDADGSGSTTKKSDSGASDSAGSSRSGTSKKTEKPTTSGASKTSD